MIDLHLSDPVRLVTYVTYLSTYATQVDRIGGWNPINDLHRVDETSDLRDDLPCHMDSVLLASDLPTYRFAHFQRINRKTMRINSSDLAADKWEIFRLCGTRVTYAAAYRWTRIREQVPNWPTEKPAETCQGPRKMSAALSVARGPEHPTTIGCFQTLRQVQTCIQVNFELS